ncbi:hypothetical protein L6452_08733 [Arctium lappa]|uniref:Uncharacterized protein n=1 Tax=Arctium lappa TaxID=4217 RepID=A0ACB9DJ77_ARCLA|nr:hypothetical protein L6452_08733 [Arctium lappa]
MASLQSICDRDGDGVMGFLKTIPREIRSLRIYVGKFLCFEGIEDKQHVLLLNSTEPLLDGSDQILVVVDVLIANDKRINNNPDWYAILQLDSRRNDDELIKHSTIGLPFFYPKMGYDY